MTSAAGGDYGTMISALREFHDQLAFAEPGSALVHEMTETLTRWSGDLSACQRPEAERPIGHGTGMSPLLTVTSQTETELHATVRFGHYYVGRGAAHGGAVSLVWDEVLGRITQMDGPKVARTAYLHVNYRSITPIDRVLRVQARLVSVNGRKRVAAGEMYDGDVLCTDAEGLFVELKPGQP